VERKGSLDPDAEGLLADGEGLARPAPLPLDHDALEDLGPLTVALDDLEVDRTRSPARKAAPLRCFSL
jgi:hypothetical protein